MKKRLISLIAVTLVGISAMAQSAVSTAGGEAGTVSYTIGQPIYQMAVSSKGSLQAGVQQAYAITVVGGIDNNFVTLQADVYPNPTVDWLTLTIDAPTTGQMSYTIISSNGRTLANADISSNQTAIDMSQLSPAIYMLKVTNGNTAVRTFKIVKK